MMRLSATVLDVVDGNIFPIPACCLMRRHRAIRELASAIMRNWRNYVARSVSG